MDDKEFAEELGKIYNDLASKQTKLEPEFQKVLDDNWIDLIKDANKDDN